MRLRPALIDFPVRPIDVAAQCAAFFFCQSAIGTLPALGWPFGATKIPLGRGLALKSAGRLGLALKSAGRLGLALESARRFALHLGGEYTAGLAMPRSRACRLREQRRDRQNCAYQGFHQSQRRCWDTIN